MKTSIFNPRVVVCVAGMTVYYATLLSVAFYIESQRKDNDQFYIGEYPQRLDIQKPARNEQAPDLKNLKLEAQSHCNKVGTFV